MFLNSVGSCFIVGAPPSVETPYGPYPLLVDSKANPQRKVLVVQAFAYSKYLGRLKVTFDDQGRATEWSGNPILLDKSVQKDSKIEQEILKMKGAVDQISEVRGLVARVQEMTHGIARV